MSFFSRAAAGAGSAVSEIANKYIDESIAEQRAQALADIARNSSMQQMKDTDAYTRDPNRLAQIRGETSLDRVAAGADADRVALATATNVPLREAAIARTNAITAGTADAEAKAAGTKQRAITDNTAHDVAPGGTVIIGAGSNDKATAAELSYRALKEELKGKKGEARDRAVEALIKSSADLLEKKQAAYDKYLAENPDALKKPEGEKHWYGNSDPKPNPAYENAQRMLDDMNQLKKERDAAVKSYSSGSRSGSSTGDPLSLGRGAAPNDPNLPAPLRNNNPGALMPGGKLATFTTMEEGMAAADANLAGYQKKYGADTIAKVIGKWAPPNENNTAAYIADVAARTGIGANDTIDLSDPEVRSQVLQAIVIHENGEGAVRAYAKRAGGSDPTVQTSAAAPTAADPAGLRPQPVAGGLMDKAQAAYPERRFPAATAPAPAEPAGPTAAEVLNAKDAVRPEDRSRMRIADAQKRKDAADAAEAAKMAETRQQFDRDMAAMPAQDFARKYDEQRGKLSTMQLAQLSKIIKGL